MTWKYMRQHIPSGSLDEDTFEASTMLEALAQVNDWNRQATLGSKSVWWLYYLVGPAS